LYYAKGYRDFRGDTFIICQGEREDGRMRRMRLWKEHQQGEANMPP
jgi:hypothetical protein